MGFDHHLFKCSYGIIKGTVVKVFGKSHENLVSTLALILTTIFLSISFVLIFPWYIFQFIVKTYLVLVLRDKFGGFLSLNTFMEHTKMTYTVVYVLEHHGTDQQLLVNVNMACQNLMRSHYRFASIVRRCCGYYYFLKEEVSIDDVVSVSEEKCSTKKDLLDYLRKNCFYRLDGNAKLWCVKVFKNPITWNGHNKTCYYPIVITYNHCLADAICLAVFQQKFLLDNVVQNKFENALSKTSKGNLMESNIVELAPIMLEKSLSFLRNPENPDQNLALLIEEKPKYLGLIRELSKRVQCTFTDVLLIASVVALTDYLGEKDTFPRKIMASNTRRLLDEDISALLTGRIFNNEISMDLYALPDVRSKSLLEAFLELKKVLHSQRNRSTSQFLYVNKIIMSYLPPEVLLRLWGPIGQNCLVCVTNIPGADFARFGGAVVRDSFVFVNHIVDIRYVMSIHSYGGRLQVSLISEKYLKTSAEDLQQILSKTFKVIADLCAQCNSL